MTSMALAATLFGPEDLRMVERPLDPLAPGMVRIRFGAGGICGSDMHYYRHARTGDFVVTSPLVLGHEIAGPGMAEIVHVRAADAAGAEADAHHACGQLVERMLDHAQIFRSKQGRGESSGGHLESPMYFGSQRVSSGM